MVSPQCLSDSYSSFDREEGGYSCLGSSFYKAEIPRAETPGPPLVHGVIDRLMAYHWPRNVRELENVIERALILSKGQPLTFDDLAGGKPNDRSLIHVEPQDAPLKLDEVTSQHIRRVLEMTKGKVHGKGGAAEVLGINPSTLRNRMNQLGIPYGRRRQ